VSRSSRRATCSYTRIAMVEEASEHKKRSMSQDNDLAELASKSAKQDPAGKGTRSEDALAGKVFFSYAQIHETICSLIPALAAWKPDVIVAIGGGGFIPARMLRTQLKIPILAVSLELYDDATNTARKEVKKVQWFDDAAATDDSTRVRGRRVLIVDEVDDTRTTTQYCCEELLKSGPAAVAVAVVHNKDKPKRGTIPEGVDYFAGATVPDLWNCYPWDSAAYGLSIREHEARATAREQMPISMRSEK
jgi:hypoxanthine phosphoribosyltransferase